MSSCPTTPSTIRTLNDRPWLLCRSCCSMTTRQLTISGSNAASFLTSSRTRAVSACECAMCRMVICSGVCILCSRESALPIDAHGVLVVAVAEFEIAVIGVLERLADTLRQLDIGGRDDDPIERLLGLHDAVQR